MSFFLFNRFILSGAGRGRPVVHRLFRGFVNSTSWTSNSLVAIVFGLSALVGLSYLRFKRWEKWFSGAISFLVLLQILLPRAKRGVRSRFVVVDLWSFRVSFCVAFTDYWTGL